MTSDAARPVLLTAAVLVRDDGRTLLVRHRAEGPFASRWTLPLAPVAAHEAAEDALVRVLREQLRVQPGPYEFQDTLYLVGVDGSRFIVNAFTCVDWTGEPRFSARHYQDAAWVSGAPSGLDLADGLRDWLAGAFGIEAAASATPEALAETLAAARADLVAAFEAIPAHLRTEPLDGAWSPLDLLAHVADVESYYAAEARRLLELPGHTWRQFNDAQWQATHRLRAADDEATLRDRLEAVRAETLGWLDALTEDDLATFGNHPERGAVRVGERIDKIARHDREHAAQLRTMEQAARVASRGEDN